MVDMRRGRLDSAPGAQPFRDYSMMLTPRVDAVDRFAMVAAGSMERDDSNTIHLREEHDLRISRCHGTGALSEKW